jgi:hypothetical protein
MILNNELWRTWKVPIVAELNVCSRSCSEVLKNVKTLSVDGQCHGREWSMASPEHELEAFPYGPHFWVSGRLSSCAYRQIDKIKVEGNDVPVLNEFSSKPWTCTEMGRRAPLFFGVSTRCDWLTSNSGHFLQVKRHRFEMERRLGEFQSRFGLCGFGKISSSALNGNRPSSF